MEHDSKAYLFDIKQACEEIEDFVRGIDFEKYCSKKPLINRQIKDYLPTNHTKSH
jgi:uncharacterized protein with HEPN domain